MSTTSAINQQNGTTKAAAAAPAANSINSLGIGDFLTLMTTQLKNQDPFKPLDGTEMVAQLAQFGTVSGVQSMNTQLTALAASLKSSQALSGTTMVGHQILAQADGVNFDGQAPVVGTTQVPDGASGVAMTVSDSSGQVIRHLSLGTATGGQAFQWDGRDDAGKLVAAGHYKLAAIANVGGEHKGLALSVAARVGSVSLNGTDLTLNTRELGTVALGSVQQII